MKSMIALYRKAMELQLGLAEEIVNSGIAWQHLADQNEDILAIRAYRKQHNVGLREAKDALDAFKAQR